MELKLYTAPLTEILGWSNIKPVMLFRLVYSQSPEIWYPEQEDIPVSWLFDPPEDVYVTYSHTEDKKDADF